MLHYKILVQAKGSERVLYQYLYLYARRRAPTVLAAKLWASVPFPSPNDKLFLHLQKLLDCARTVSIVFP